MIIVVNFQAIEADPASGASSAIRSEIPIIDVLITGV